MSDTSIDFLTDDIESDSVEPYTNPAEDYSDCYDTDTVPEDCLVRMLLGEEVRRIHPRFTTILNHIYDARELGLVHEQMLIDAGILPAYVAVLKQALADYGLSLLDPREYPIMAMARHYGSRSQIPLRILFFDSVVPSKLVRLRITTLGELTARSYQWLNSAHYINTLADPIEVTRALDDLDMIEIQTGLAGIGLTLKGAVPLVK